MALQEQKAKSSLERYIAEVRSVWGDGKDPQLPFKVKALMEKLFVSTMPDAPWMAELIRDGLPSRELYRDPEKIVDNRFVRKLEDEGFFRSLYAKK